MNQEILQELKPSKTTTVLPMGPGTYLRKRREMRHQTQHDIAKQLQLNPLIIDAIENDRYDELPGAIFVRGYLRGYARLLNLAEDEIIQAFNNLGIASEENPAPKMLSNTYPQPRKKVKSSSFSFWKMSPYFLIIILGALVAVSYVGIPSHLLNGLSFSASTVSPQSKTEPVAFPAETAPQSTAEQQEQSITIEGSAPWVKPLAENTVPLIRPSEDFSVSAGE